MRIIRLGSVTCMTFHFISTHSLPYFQKNALKHTIYFVEFDDFQEQMQFGQTPVIDIEMSAKPQNY